MNIPKISKITDHIDDDLISEAVEYKSTKEKNACVKWIAVAACLCLIMAVIMFGQTATSPIEKNSDVVLTENGVKIPNMKISLNDKSDMIGFFIYHGKCYARYESVNNIEIVGKYVGTSTGLIDEWSPEEGYVELAGNVKGDFFTVKGYDPAFMLCMKEGPDAVTTYICNNGITLKYGSELYEDRLHLSDNYSSVQCETHESWNNSKNDLYQIKCNDKVINSFIEQLDKAEFIPCPGVTASENKKTSYIDGNEIYHLYFKMYNGMTIHLILYENGYICFHGLRDVCVQIPKESFTPLVDLIKSSSN